MIIPFTRNQFEDALPVHKETHDPLWIPLGVQQGEYTYYMPIDNLSGIMIRSSVDSTGNSAAAGTDSIRCWLVHSAADHQPLGTKLAKYITRTVGWTIRLSTTLRMLWEYRQHAGNCPACGAPLGIYKVKRGSNKGKIFACCTTNNRHKWVWITDANGKFI